MPRVEGRDRKRPVAAHAFVGDRLILRVDDLRDPEFWLTLNFSPIEFGDLFDAFADWLYQTNQHAQLDRLMLKRDEPREGNSAGS